MLAHCRCYPCSSRQNKTQNKHRKSKWTVTCLFQEATTVQLWGSSQQVALETKDLLRGVSTKALFWNHLNKAMTRKYEFKLEDCESNVKYFFTQKIRLNAQKTI